MHKDINEYSVKCMDRLFINENSTQKRKQPFWHTKHAKEVNDKFIWTKNGNLCVELLNFILIQDFGISQKTILA